MGQKPRIFSIQKGTLIPLRGRYKIKGPQKCTRIPLEGHILEGHENGTKIPSKGRQKILNSIEKCSGGMVHSVEKCGGGMVH
jgi:hypothetical protein